MRRALRLEPTQSINQLLTAQKLRELSSSYLRHTIRRPIKPGDTEGLLSTQKARIRANPSDFFFIYCRQIIPRVEDSIERTLLEKFKSTLKSPLERVEVEEAYLQRKDNLAKIPEREDPASEAESKDTIVQHTDELGRVIQSFHGDGLTHHTFEDIGRYTVFPKAMTERMLPSVMFGRYQSSELERNSDRSYGIQTREEGLRITNDLSRLTLPSQRQIDYLQIAMMDNKLIKEEIMQDEENYVAVYQDMCLSLLDFIEN